MRSLALDMAETIITVDRNSKALARDNPRNTS
jgi:hypothetical protein